MGKKKGKKKAGKESKKGLFSGVKMDDVKLNDVKF